MESASADSHKVSIAALDTRTGATRWVLPIPITAGLGGGDFVLDPAGARLYATEYGSDQVTVIDVSRQPRQVLTAIGVHSTPVAAVLDAATHRLYVADSYDYQISVIDSRLVGRPSYSWTWGTMFQSKKTPASVNLGGVVVVGPTSLLCCTRFGHPKTVQRRFKRHSQLRARGC